MEAEGLVFLAVSKGREKIVARKLDKKRTESANSARPRKIIIGRHKIQSPPPTHFSLEKK